MVKSIWLKLRPKVLEHLFKKTIWSNGLRCLLTFRRHFPRKLTLKCKLNMNHNRRHLTHSSWESRYRPSRQRYNLMSLKSTLLCRRDNRKNLWDKVQFLTQFSRVSLEMTRRLKFQITMVHHLVRRKIRLSQALMLRSEKLTKNILVSLQVVRQLMIVLDQPWRVEITFWLRIPILLVVNLLGIKVFSLLEVSEWVNIVRQRIRFLERSGLAWYAPVNWRH